ncbi:MAG: succinylglutamate desuccinylase/aspartoacylase family protein [bacterium]|nr:succinylglutamate desuccinylase/aspartoacylase family protein [bacterium]
MKQFTNSLTNKSTNPRTPQIGVIGTMGDIQYSKKIESLAESIGEEIAKNGATLVFGAEKDYDSLSSAACRGAKKAGGLTVGVTYGKGLTVAESNADVIIATGMERGGGRELPLVLSCDVVISIGGGSGTLNEITIAYQAGIPVVALKGSGGWSDSLAGYYLDSRKRFKIQTVTDPARAVTMALALIRTRDQRPKEILLIAATHGNETIGAEVLRRVSQETQNINYDWLIGNERAVKNNTRYVDTDLNRSAPGDKNSPAYEERRAAELVSASQNYRYVIDLHGTGAKTGIVTIVTNPTLENLLLAAALPVKNIVIWSSKRSAARGPITRFVPCGVEIEAGPKNDPAVQQELYRVVYQIVSQGIRPTLNMMREKNIFQVYGRVEKEFISPEEARQLKDFQKTSINGQILYPFIVGQYADYWCYALKRVELENVFQY